MQWCKWHTWHSNYLWNHQMRLTIFPSSICYNIGYSQWITYKQLIPLPLTLIEVMLYKYWIMCCFVEEKVNRIRALAFEIAFIKMKWCLLLQLWPIMINQKSFDIKVGQLKQHVCLILYKSSIGDEQSLIAKILKSKQVILSCHVYLQLRKVTYEEYLIGPKSVLQSPRYWYASIGRCVPVLWASGYY